MLKLKVGVSVLILIGILQNVKAQNTFGGVAASGLDANTAIGGFISQIDNTNYEPVGNVYVNDDWEVANILLRNNKEVKDLNIRINLLKNSIDIKDKSTIRTFTMEKIKYLDLQVLSDSSTRYYNPFEFRFYDNTPVVGLLRKVTDKDNEWNLVERTYLKIFEATYVKALDAGTRNDRYEVQKELYLAKDNKLYPIVPNKKKLASSLELTETKQDALIGYIKSNKINLKDYSAGRKLLVYLNE